MAMQMTITTLDGVEHPESYWRVTFVRMDIDRMEAYVSFSGYHNSSARDTKKNTIASKEYFVTGDTFTQYFGIPVLSGKGNPVANTYALAKATLDTPDPTNTNTSVSFFANAIDIS